MKQIINIDSLDWKMDDVGDFSYARKQLGRPTGGEKLGTSLFKLMPGKKAFPYHFHHANEEAIFILEGEGTLRLNNEMLPVKKNDYIALPVGPDHAHQMINTSHAPLLYLCISTMIHPEVSEYPDSKKIGISAGAAPGATSDKYLLKAYYKKDSHVDYFENEKVT